ncbi:AbrB/MazE/SpoVT family DNA-binding domain-containing protein [Microvirga antarctica]|uniref:AbrB/MazE/SpoVT family DNA-binding domain-containing protein n=1 Tax=Microvirga antarctica TaxID=2819233 RepID=UPI001B3079AE|nr:AbrB/MazE/SpoVT family DNA-binding domain-containing protein [Microvirga antarctica]
MIVHFAKWGNSVALRIPSAFARQIHAVEGTSADLTIENGRLVITPAENVPVYTLADLLAEMTPKTIHDETDTGVAVGNEF